MLEYNIPAETQCRVAGTMEVVELNVGGRIFSRLDPPCANIAVVCWLQCSQEICSQRSKTNKDASL